MCLRRFMTLALQAYYSDGLRCLWQCTHTWHHITYSCHPTLNHMGAIGAKTISVPNIHRSKSIPALAKELSTVSRPS